MRRLSRTRAAPRALAAATLTLACVPPSARSATPASWVGPANGIWLQGVRWTTNPFYPNLGNPAGATYAAVIDAAGQPYTVTLGTTAIEVETLDLRSPDARFLHDGVLRVGPYQGENGAAALTVGGGATYVLGGGTLHVVGDIGHSAVGRGGAGTFLHDGGTILQSAPRFIVGDGSTSGAGTGTYIMSGPTARWLTDPEYWTHWQTVGHGAGGVGTMIFRQGAAPRLSVTEVGTSQGSGTLSVTSGAHVRSQQFWVGGNATPGNEGSGTILLSDPTSRISVENPISDGLAIIGVNSDVGGGTVLISAGTFLNTGLTQVRRSGYLDVSGGVTSHAAVSVLGRMRLGGGGQVVCSAGSFGVAAGGSVTITGGSLLAPRLRVLDVGTQTLHVSGGAVAVGSLEMLSGAATVSGGATVTASGSFALGGVARFTQAGGTVATPQFLVNGGTATYAAGTLNVSTLSVTGGRFTMPPGAGLTLRVTTLDVAGTGRLDLNDNGLLVDYTGASPITAVRQDIAAGFAGGGWNGFGITSGLADASVRGIGYAEGLDTSVIVRLARYGDANLDGAVNLQDFNRLAAGFGATTGALWSQGDFNYDAAVNLQDFNLLAGNFGMSAAGPDVTPADWAALAAAVPEPAAAVGAIATAASLLRPRRQRRVLR
jgi:hypothetical protein